MLNLFIGVAVGLVVGWNLLPQPQWSKDLYAKAAAKLRGE